MNTLSFALPTALMLAASSYATDKEIITKTLAANSGGKLVMKVDRGSIRVKAVDSGQVDIKIAREVRRASANAAREIYSAHKVEIAQQGDTITITSAGKPKGFRWFSNPFNKLQVEYTVAIPSRFNLDLQTAGGNIDLPDLTGTVRAWTSSGNVVAGAINGSVELETAGGDVTLGSATGKTHLRSSGGNIKVYDAEAEMTAMTSGGNIAVERARGSLHAETSGGHITVTEALGPVSAQTSGGNVSASFLQTPSGGCKLSTSGGHVALTLPGPAAVNLRAKTSGGTIQSDFPGNTDNSRSKFVAHLNGGGPEILLETSGGNIKIHRR